MIDRFREKFEDLTDRKAYPWQEALFNSFLAGNWPRTLCLPTGAGKTSVIPIWILARAAGAKVPRRLVWVVNRRVVVDQATEEAERLAVRLKKVDELEHLDLAVSTLRGEKADNREWSQDPSRPAVVIGTVDMVGSRLLFSGYGDGKWYRPQHAGLLGNDALIVNDEAHLTPAFAQLIERVAELQPPAADFRTLLLTATPRGDGARWPESLAADIESHPTFRKRFEGVKNLSLRTASRRVDDELVKLACEAEGGPRRLVFVRSPEKAADIARAIKRKTESDRVCLLTGTMRGHERDKLALHPVFNEFKSDSIPGERCWLVSTSAGEVGVDISSDVLITELEAADSLAQRFGRLNRFGETRGEAYVVRADSEKDARRLEAWRYLEGLPDVSCATLFKRPVPEGANSPTRPTAILQPRVIDLWSMTSVGRSDAKPPVESWLHGQAEDDLPETEIVWREDIHWLAAESVDETEREEALKRHRIRAHERLKELSSRAAKKLQELDGKTRIILIRPDGSNEAMRLAEAIDPPTNLNYATVLLPVGCGRLEHGMLSMSAEAVIASDVADEDSGGRRERIRYFAHRDGDGWLRRQLGGTGPHEEERVDNLASPGAYIVDIPAEGDDGQASQALVYWQERAKQRESAGEVLLGDHCQQVSERAGKLARDLGFDEQLVRAFETAGRLHDRGKRREVWQNAAGGSMERPIAKSDGAMRPWQLAGYRHELGSLLDTEPADLAEFDEATRELILHLVASHHGWARPHFRPRARDRECVRKSEQEGAESTRRFGRLQERWGAWRLAYLEAVFKAADGMVSAAPEEQS